jgi:hypothetical protein
MFDDHASSLSVDANGTVVAGLVHRVARRDELLLDIMTRVSSLK